MIQITDQKIWPDMTQFASNNDIVNNSYNPNEKYPLLQLLKNT